jgi:hypothetical protein
MAQPGEVVVGWATYLAPPRLVQVDRLPVGVMTEAIGHGVLITIGADPSLVSESLVIAVRSCLDQGLGSASA